MEVYENIKNIGQGMFGQVFLAKHKIENKLYAVKRINFQDINEKERNNIENEVQLLQELRHPNIVQYKDSFSDKENNYNIVMMYCDGGDIYSKIKNAKGKHFPENEILDWIVQLGLALSYIHDKKILHRDMKTQNIFLQNGKIRIGDFGIAKMFNQTKDMAGSIVGTPLYMSPEQYNGKKYGFKSDIWSLGCCLFEMCNLKHCFEGNSWNAVVVKVIKGQRAQLNSIYSKDLKALIDQMLSLNPKSRPTVAGLLEKAFMKPRVAAYIQDFIQNYQKYDGDELQMEILKDQAEKFGIFNKMVKDIGGIGIGDGIENKNWNKDIDDLNSINELERQSLYEQKKKLEAMIMELEKKKKAELEQLTSKSKGHGYGYVQGQIAHPQRQGKGNEKLFEMNDIKANNNSNNNSSFNSNSNSKDKSKKSYSIEKSHFNANPSSNSLEKGKSSLQKKYSTHNPKRDDKDKESPMKGQRKNSEEYHNSNKISEKNAGNIIQLSQEQSRSKFNRPLTGKRDEGNQSFNKDEGLIGDRNKITKITQEIGKMKKCLEQTIMKIQKNQNENNEIAECEEVDNYSNDEENSKKEILTETPVVETDKQKKLGERIKFFRTRCENSLGKKLTNKAYEYLKNNRNAEPSEAREHLINLFGKDNIGFWQLIEQILILEDIMAS